MCESFWGCAPRRNFPKIRFKFFKLVLNKINFFVVMNENVLRHGGASNIIIPRQRNKSTRSTRFLPRQRQGD